MYANDDTGQIVSPEAVARRLRLDYSRGVKDQTQKILEELIDINTKIDDTKVPIRNILEQCCELISKRLGIASVGVGLRDFSDGRYRYEALVGLPDETVAQLKKISYTREELTSSASYKSYEISRRSRIYLSEDHPYAEGEESSYLRPGLLEMKRRSLTDSLEADYIDTFFNDSKGEILGWIEISGTRTKKIPDATCVKWTELISFLLATAMRIRHPGVL